MSFEQQTARIERLIGLMERSHTGTAEELAKKLCVSRRTIFNDFDFLKGRGYEINYCNADGSYHCEKKLKKPSFF